MSKTGRTDHRAARTLRLPTSTPLDGALSDGYSYGGQCWLHSSINPQRVRNALRTMGWDAHIECMGHAPREWRVFVIDPGDPTTIAYFGPENEDEFVKPFAPYWIETCVTPSEIRRVISEGIYRAAVEDGNA